MPMSVKSEERGRETESQSSLPQVLPLVYHELRRLGRTLLRSERRNHTLQPTAVVNEAYLRLAGIDLHVHDSKHCYYLVAQAMRRVLIDHAKRKNRLKREMPLSLDTLEDGKAVTLQFDLLDMTIANLALKSPEAAEMVQLRYFCGFEDAEIAAVQCCSVPTVQRTVRFAKAWLLQQMNSQARSSSDAMIEVVETLDR